jgi:hypothetical protein
LFEKQPSPLRGAGQATIIVGAQVVR